MGGVLVSCFLFLVSFFLFLLPSLLLLLLDVGFIPAFFFWMFISLKYFSSSKTWCLLWIFVIGLVGFVGKSMKKKDDRWWYMIDDRCYFTPTIDIQSHLPFSSVLDLLKKHTWAKHQTYLMCRAGTIWVVVSNTFYFDSLLRDDSVGWFGIGEEILFIFTPILVEMIQFDEHIFQIGLKPPTRIS